MSDVDAKQEARERVWQRLEQSGASPRGAVGRIPEFTGSDDAAERLTELPQWQTAETIKANPDRPQLGARRRALHGGKLVYMAVPNLASPEPFFRLSPNQLRERGLSLDEVAEHKRAQELAPKTPLDKMLPVDLIVCGTVAVDRRGVRVGKGAGYSDIEVALLAQSGLLSAHTTIVTTVHELQVVDYDLPHDRHDFTVDYIITPDDVIRCDNPYRPTGLVWESLTPAQIARIPVLAAIRDAEQQPPAR